MIAALVVSVFGQDRAEASDTATRWDSFSESSTCGAPYTRGPFASKMGSLADSEPLLGPFGTYFGRSISEIRDQLVYWTVPYSGGRRVRVHQAMFPSLQKVAEKLADHASEGRIYPIDSASAFVPRTIGGRYQMSRHAMGLAVDFNPAQNPYRDDGTLITNMPAWFVEAWTSSGFCWGGHWPTIKDPMHFAWMGPHATSSTTDSLTPRPPKTTKSSFRSVGSHDTVFHNVMSRYEFAVADGTGNGAPDMIGLRPHPGGTVIDMASSTGGLGECSILRWFVSDESLHEPDLLFLADLDGDSGQDLVALFANGSQMVAKTATRGQRFKDLTSQATGVAADTAAVTGADFDGDGLADLWEATADGRIRVWRGPAFTEKIHESALGSTPLFIAAGDRDGGNRPELFTLHANESSSLVTAHTLSSGTWSGEQTITIAINPDNVVAFGAVDYDGDGRADTQIFDSSGRLSAYAPNSPTGIPSSRWFLDPNHDCQPWDVRLVFRGSFYDDDDSIFEADIESIAAVGVTRGCNPPFNDRFCPKHVVTRETMAAFLVRALGLTANTHPGFVDVPADSTFAADIGKLATAEITKGCNPPANDMFCPKNAVTRETMAAFLVRALNLTDDTHPGFVDVSSSNMFRADIERLATAGITRGCNPPTNDRFCPKDFVTRETMAAFLDRAGLGS